MQAVILAAGKGTRMRSEKPKVLHDVLGRPMIDRVFETLGSLKIRNLVVVVGAGADQVKKHLAGRASFVMQREQKGTGHAVIMTQKALAASKDEVLIWPGDMPMVKVETLKEFIRCHKRSKAVVSVLSALQADPKGYGRILRAGGRFIGIREELDASEAERRIQEVNTGIYLYDKKTLFRALKKIKPNNKKNELYLTDTIEVLSKEGAVLEAFPLAEASEGQGVNSKIDLGRMNEEMNAKNIRRLQEAGVTFVCPSQSYVAGNASIGQDTVIHPWTYIERDVRIGKNCQIGPFAKLRAGTSIGDGSVIGSFVEVSRTKMGKNVFAKHLTYLGDSIIGDGTNIGAGTITANFDGKNKNQTRIGKKVLVGSDTVFVAPVTIGDGARTGAGSVVKAGSHVKKGETVAGVPARALKKQLTKKKR